MSATAALHSIVRAAGPDGEPVRIVVERQLLRLDARSEQGEVLQGIGLLAEAYDPDRSAVPPGGDPSSPSVRKPPWCADAEGRLLLLLLSPFAWTWRIRSADDAAAPASLRHDVIPGLHRADRMLVLAAQTEFGDVRFDVVDPSGDP